MTTSPLVLSSASLRAPHSSIWSARAASPAAGVDRHSRSEWLYFWFYFVIVNGIWIVVPLACIVHACTKLSGAMAA
jgi:hypothetical protein